MTKGSVLDHGSLEIQGLGARVDQESCGRIYELGMVGNVGVYRDDGVDFVGALLVNGGSVSKGAGSEVGCDLKKGLEDVQEDLKGRQRRTTPGGSNSLQHEECDLVGAHAQSA
ncbi:hypothetical protein VNO78_09629 [Psophocarpus tetragonolobus]|uniref:Uncharacterized protein n=1 Tax=Psophocarpus tetragonolobus TaxID=3891 RepID=A0AAN9XTQ3_PSOTE